MKKQQPTRSKKSDSFLGFMHFLIGGFVVPIGLAILVVVIMIPIVLFIYGVSPESNFATALENKTLSYSFIAVGILLTLAGAFLGASFMRRKYTMKNTDNVALIATYWIAGWTVAGVIVELIMPATGEQPSAFTTDLSDPIYAVLYVLASAIGIAVFYVASKRFLNKR